MPLSSFAYIWEYQVKEVHLDAFEHAYGPHGDWVRLFKEANGYIDTHLHKDINNPFHFVTVDFWSTREAYEKFKARFSNEFEKLDEFCGEFTKSEKFIGDFECTFSPPNSA